MSDPPKSAAWLRFISSLPLGLDSWRDGAGYDLAALKEMTEQERSGVREMIASRLANSSSPADWRDLEAAQALGLNDAIAKRIDDADPLTRLRAKEALGDSEAVIAELCETIENGRNADAVSKALDRVASYPTDAVKRAVIARVRRVDSQFIWASMVMLEVFGGVDDAFAERPFLFEVQAQGPNGELMATLLSRV